MNKEYTIITKDEFEKSIYIENNEDFTKKEIASLPYDLKIDTNNYLSIMSLYDRTCLKYIRITKTKDEWFYVRYDNYYHYKCDQITGLINCIDNILSSISLIDSYSYNILSNL